LIVSRRPVSHVCRLTNSISCFRNPGCPRAPPTNSTPPPKASSPGLQIILFLTALLAAVPAVYGFKYVQVSIGHNYTGIPQVRSPDHLLHQVVTSRHGSRHAPLALVVEVFLLPFALPPLPLPLLVPQCHVL
ncbi:hypothetical protein DFH08DRAFT_850397, partial [Mycena albidolilacea]